MERERGKVREKSKVFLLMLRTWACRRSRRRRRDGKDSLELKAIKMVEIKKALVGGGEKEKGGGVRDVFSMLSLFGVFIPVDVLNVRRI